MKGLGNEGNLFASGCGGKSGGIGGGLDSCDNNEGIFSEVSESLASLELTRRGIRLFAMSSNTLRFCRVAKRQSILSPLSSHWGIFSNNTFNDSSEVTTTSAKPLDWPLALFSANLISLMSFTPNV